MEKICIKMNKGNNNIFIQHQRNTYIYIQRVGYTLIKVCCKSALKLWNAASQTRL